MKTPTPSPEMLATLRTRLGLSDSDSSKDTLINQSFAMAVLWLEQYLNRVLWAENGEVTETLPHYRGKTVSLSGYPIDPQRPIVITAYNGAAVPEYTADMTNGLLLFGGFTWLREVTVSYSITDILAGPLNYALLLMFDQMRAALDTSGLANQAGPVKAISSDGSRIEFDTSNGSGATTATIDAAESIPTLALGLLQTYRRTVC